MTPFAVSALNLIGTGLEFSASENTGIFTFTDAKPMRQVGIRVDGDTLQFFPERSSAHKELMKMLGIPS